MATSPEDRLIVVRSFPASDRDFADAAGAALGEARRATDDPDAIRDIVLDRLGRDYRNARIQVQDELAELGSGEVIWYVYRDGRIRDVDAHRERLYEVVASARRTLQTTEATLEHSRTISRIAGFDPERRPVSVTPPRPPSPPRAAAPRPPRARPED
jgi:hypothetical protein